MTTGKGPRLSWSRLAIGISIGLVVFGTIDAILPHATRPGSGTSGVGAKAIPHSVAQGGPVQDSAAQRVAEEFVEATETTDPTHPEGDTAERTALAPALAVPRRVAWPEAWVAENRQTTVVLDPPGPVVAVGSDRVAVVLTGWSVVTTNAGQSPEVPVDERITLRPIGPTNTANASDWVVTDVGSGS